MSRRSASGNSTYQLVGFPQVRPASAYPVDDDPARAEHGGLHPHGSARFGLVGEVDGGLVGHGQVSVGWWLGVGLATPHMSHAGPKTSIGPAEDSLLLRNGWRRMVTAPRAILLACSRSWSRGPAPFPASSPTVGPVAARWRGWPIRPPTRKRAVVANAGRWGETLDGRYRTGQGVNFGTGTPIRFINRLKPVTLRLPGFCIPGT